MTRQHAGWIEGMPVYVRWAGNLRQGTLARLRDADDGTQDISVAPGTVRVYFRGDGERNVPWLDVRSTNEHGS